MGRAACQKQSASPPLCDGEIRKINRDQGYNSWKHTLTAVSECVTVSSSGDSVTKKHTREILVKNDFFLSAAESR